MALLGSWSRWFFLELVTLASAMGSWTSLLLVTLVVGCQSSLLVTPVVGSQSFLLVTPPLVCKGSPSYEVPADDTSSGLGGEWA